MAFSFDTFAKDQKQSAIDIVDTITPSQVKQVGAAYKAGLNASPKQVINETLESFTGVDLSQGAGVDGLGAQAKNFIEGQAASLTMQLEQQILGCINTAIRDLMNYGLAHMDIPPFNCQSPMMVTMMQKLFNIPSNFVLLQNFTMFDKTGKAYTPSVGGKPAL